MNRITRGSALLVGAALAIFGLQAVPASAADAACAALDDTIYSVVNPTTKQQLLTPWEGEATDAAQYGYTQKTEFFKASNIAATGLVPIFQLRKTSTNDTLYTASTSERDNAVAAGFTYQRVAFHASAADLDCSAPVRRYSNGVQHRIAQTADQVTALGSGWNAEGIFFYAIPLAGATPSPTPTPTPTLTPTPTPTPTTPPATGTFKFAVIPDTQNEVLQAGDNRIANRNQYIVDQDSKFALHTGDLHNWDTADHIQYERSKPQMDVLTNGGVPYSIGIGNHDTQATGVGGSARDATNSFNLQKDTSTINAYYQADDLGVVSGAFEAGKIDNIYSKYTAGGKKWMVVTLEFAPRTTAINWAKGIIAANPDYNVIINTHTFLTSSGTISQSNEGYGSNSPQTLWNAINDYSNVKLIFSGHTGVATTGKPLTTDTGSRAYAYLGTFHDGTRNPVRMLTVNTATEDITTQVIAPNNGYVWTEYGDTVTDLDLV